MSCETTQTKTLQSTSLQEFDICLCVLSIGKLISVFFACIMLQKKKINTQNKYFIVFNVNLLFSNN